MRGDICQEVGEEKSWGTHANVVQPWQESMQELRAGLSNQLGHARVSAFDAPNGGHTWERPEREHEFPQGKKTNSSELQPAYSFHSRAKGAYKREKCLGEADERS